MNRNILNEYSIKGTIGQGAFSKVKLGINKLTGEKVAIKIKISFIYYSIKRSY